MELVARVETSYFNFNNNPSIINLHPMNTQYNQLKVKYFNSAQYKRWIGRSFFQQLHLNSGMKILDLGYFFGDLWCENSTKLSSDYQVVLCDELLVNVRLSQQNLKLNGLQYPVELINYNYLKFENESFDKVICCLDFEINDTLKQFKKIEECYRVSKRDGCCYFFNNNNHDQRTLNQLLQMFDEKINIKLGDSYIDKEDIEKKLREKFEQIERVNYTNYSELDSADDLVNLLIASKNSTFIEEVVKKHRTREFVIFINRYLKESGHIQLNNEFNLFICHKNNLNYH